MNQEFKGKVVIITGSGQGIGKALAKIMAENGAKVVLNDYHEEKLNNSLKEIDKITEHYHGFLGDISDWDTCQELMRQAVEKFGAIDYLVNNAAIATRGSTEKLVHEIFSAMIRINILGSVFPAKAALPYLKKSKGYVLFISSLASFHGLPYNGVYCATKRALTAFEQSLYHETKHEGIRTGVAYVSFTENDPKKVIYDTDGTKIYMQNRNGVKKNTRKQAAYTLATMMSNRERRKIFGTRGKVFWFLAGVFPNILEMYLSSRRLYIKSQSEGPATKADS